MAAGFHVRANEHLNVLETTLLACIGAAIAIGRWDLIDSSADVSPLTLVVALCLLVPAAIINVIVLYSGNGEEAAPANSSSGQVDGARQPVG
jgi:F0F1-type ATP synthase assembly protein I